MTLKTLFAERFEAENLKSDILLLGRSALLRVTTVMLLATDGKQCRWILSSSVINVDLLKGIFRADCKFLMI